jgi:hypothetical protein
MNDFMPFDDPKITVHVMKYLVAKQILAIFVTKIKQLGCDDIYIC